MEIGVEVEQNYIDEDLIINKEYYEHVKEQLCCPICTCLLNDPRMCESCEIAYCRECINTWFQKKTECPNRCKSGKKSSIKPISKSITRVIDGLKLKCKYGCEVPLLSFNSHSKSCELAHKQVLCFNCNRIANYSELKIKSEDELNFLKNTIINLEQKESFYIKNMEALQRNNEMLEKRISDLEKGGSKGQLKSQLFPVKIMDSIILDENSEKRIFEWIKGVINYRLKLLYRASRDGHGCSVFHDKCDNKGPTLVVCKTSFGKIIGGFTKMPWKYPTIGGLFFIDESYSSFLFSITLGEKYPLKEGKYVICGDKSYGPIIGNFDLLLVDNSNKNNIVNCDIGTCYDFKGNKNDFYGGIPFKVEDYEVFQLISG